MSQSKRCRSWLLWTVLILVVFTALQMVQAKGHSMNIEIGDDLVAIAADRCQTVFLPLSEIRDVRLSDSLGTWVLTGGTQDENFACGTYEGELGTAAQISAYLDNGLYLVIETDEGNYICSMATDRQTQKTYDKICEALPQKEQGV